MALRRIIFSATIAKTGLERLQYINAGSKVLANYMPSRKTSESTKFKVGNTSAAFVTEEKEKKLEKKTIGQVITDNFGLRNYMQKVLITSSVGVGGSLAVAEACSYVMPDAAFGTMLTGAALSIGSAFLMEDKTTNNRTEIVIVDGKSEKIKIADIPTKSWLAYAGLVTGMGLTLSPFAQLCYEIDPSIMYKALTLTFATTSGAYFYTTTRKEGTLNKYGPVLYGSLFGFAGMGVLSLGSYFIFGLNDFMQFWSTFDTYAGIPLFAALVAHDTNMAIESYKNNKLNYVTVSAQIYADTMNILIRYMNVLAKAKKY